MVTESAKAGRGTATFVRDGATNLNGLVVKALAHSIEPSFKNTRYGFNENLSAPCELFRNSLVSATLLTTKDQLSSLKFVFGTEAADSNKALNLSFKKSDFIEVK